MFTLIAQIYQWLRQPVGTDTDDLASSLMERADARGVDPRQAQELRAAAHAYLRVVR
ncbi:MAG: hypothetical protein J0H69_12060 [Burkholderiales bacterium]|jgi:hypothetical protein|nr:hypothetical protein [Burkholderiales bacterium]